MKKLIIAIVLLFSLNLVVAQAIPKWKIADVERAMQDQNATIVVLNFWATFCKPCVAEIPGFIRVTGKFKDTVKLILVSLDLASEYPSGIRKFITRHHFNTNFAWLSETNADYFCPKVDSSWGGSIPATLMVNTKTGKRFFMEGEMEAAEYEAALLKLLK